ncbi:MAG: orotate phosphoribosyltransferase [Flavobacteriales bacterium]|nr:orotate phosphoribosyltransferase [Flavobacteriales bacterium]|tara:strand:- start:549 stop:1103 length:555 start_codon:yes stop_codon:yes gene_type:complete
MNQIEILYKRIYELEVFKKGNFTLSSGKKSSYYLDGRIISLDPLGSEMIAKIFLSKLNFSFDKIGGPATAAIPLITAISLFARAYQNKDIPGFYIRSSAKEHGLTNKIEGNIKKGDDVVIIDDTVTSGESIVNTILEVQKIGANIKLSLSVFDRNEGGAEKISQLGIKHHSIFKYDLSSENLTY